MKTVTLKIALSNSFKYIAQDMHGTWKAFEKPPIKGNNFWWNHYYQEIGQSMQINSNWRKTLRRVK